MMGEQLDREEILARSKRENQREDERERSIRVRGESFALAFMILTGFVLIVWKRLHDQPVYDVMAMFWASCTAQRLYRLSQRRNVSDIVTLAVSAALLVYYLVKFFTQPV